MTSILPVTTTAEWRACLNVPVTVYKHDLHWVEPLRIGSKHPISPIYIQTKRQEAIGKTGFEPLIMYLNWGLIPYLAHSPLWEHAVGYSL